MSAHKLHNFLFSRDAFKQWWHTNAEVTGDENTAWLAWQAALIYESQIDSQPIKVLDPTDLRNRVGMYMLTEKGCKIGAPLNCGEVQDMIVEFVERELGQVSHD